MIHQVQTSDNYIPDPSRNPPEILFYDFMIAGVTPMVKMMPYDEIIDRPQGMKGYILNLTIEGEGLVKDGNQSFICRKGDMLLFPPHVPHYYQRNPMANNWYHQWVYFFPRRYWLPYLNFDKSTPNLELSEQDAILKQHQESSSTEPTNTHNLSSQSQVNNVADATHCISTKGLQDVKTVNKETGNVGYFKVPEELFDEFSQLFVEIIKRHSSKQECSQLLAYNFLEQILMRRMELLQQPNSTAIDPRVTKACIFIHENLGEPKLTIEEVAAFVNLSASRISHLFEDSLGTSIIKWRDQERFKLACTLLVNSSLKIEQIAYRTGFNDTGYFFRFFKRFAGVTPNQYRSKNTFANIQ